MLEEINYKVLSYCEIPSDLTNDHWISEGQCDSYITHKIYTSESYSDLDKWIIETYPELLDVKFLIHLDW